MINDDLNVTMMIRSGAIVIKVTTVATGTAMRPRTTIGVKGATRTRENINHGAETIERRSEIVIGTEGVAIGKETRDGGTSDMQAENTKKREATGGEDAAALQDAMKSEHQMQYEYPI